MAEVINAIGRRKSAVARVYLTEGTGKITINKKDITEFLRLTLRIRRTSRITASSLATLVRLSVRSQVVQRLVVASSSLSVKMIYYLTIYYLLFVGCQVGNSKRTTV